jgi:NADH:ubiquinone oxidoreductase subunit B-like Fe-S oxidoreductase
MQHDLYRTALKILALVPVGIFTLCGCSPRPNTLKELLPLVRKPGAISNRAGYIFDDVHD